FSLTKEEWGEYKELSAFSTQLVKHSPSPLGGEGRVRGIVISEAITPHPDLLPQGEKESAFKVRESACNLNSFESFYSEAEARDDAMAENFLKQLSAVSNQLSANKELSAFSNQHSANNELSAISHQRSANKLNSSKADSRMLIAESFSIKADSRKLT